MDIKIDIPADKRPIIKSCIRYNPIDFSKDKPKALRIAIDLTRELRKDRYKYVDPIRAKKTPTKETNPK